MIEHAWESYHKQLLAFIQQRVANRQDAEDILSQVFEKLIQADKKAQPPQQISAWLYQVSRNAIIDYYRQRKLKQALPDDLADEQDEASAIQDLSHCLLPLIKTLPEPYQSAVLLADIDTLNHQTIADRQRISLSAAKSRVRRGREKLHQALLSCCSFHYDGAGNLLDFQQKSAMACQNCDESSFD